MWVHLKDFACEVARVGAHGVGTLPATMHTTEYATLSIWLSGFKDPITITYDSAESRDADRKALQDAIEMQ